MPKVEIKNGSLINGETQLYESSYARCLNPDCDEFAEIVNVESPNVCCDGPFAIYAAETIVDADGTVLARAPMPPPMALRWLSAGLEEAAKVAYQVYNENRAAGTTALDAHHRIRDLIAHVRDLIDPLRKRRATLDHEHGVCDEASCELCSLYRAHGVHE